MQETATLIASTCNGPPQEALNGICQQQGLVIMPMNGAACRPIMHGQKPRVPLFDSVKCYPWVLSDTQRT